jgi:hypothetical protein
MSKTEEKVIKKSMQEHIEATKETIQQWSDIKEKAEEAACQMRKRLEELEKASLESEEKLDRDLIERIEKEELERKNREERQTKEFEDIAKNLEKAKEYFYFFLIFKNRLYLE